jgi:hypothetical protein
MGFVRAGAERATSGWLPSHFSCHCLPLLPFFRPFARSFSSSNLPADLHPFLLIRLACRHLTARPPRPGTSMASASASVHSPSPSHLRSIPNTTLHTPSAQSTPSLTPRSRIGIYCVWLTSHLANNYVPSEIAGSLDANAIFLLALIVTLFKGTAATGDEKLKYIDGLILMHLCSGYIFG